jgi:antitoxin VapB
MGVYTTKTFRSGNSEAIRLPKEIAYGEGVELVIERIGDTLRIYPKARISIAEMIARLEALPVPDEKFERLPWDWPDRDGADETP